VDNYKVAVEMVEKCSLANNNFRKISEVSWMGCGLEVVFGEWEWEWDEGMGMGMGMG